MASKPKSSSSKKKKTTHKTIKKVRPKQSKTTSKKSVPKTEVVEQKTSAMDEPISQGGSTLWKMTSAILLILLLLSVYTQGFKMGSKIDYAIHDLEQLKDRADSVDLKTRLSSVVNTLNVIKAEMKPDEPEKVPPTPGQNLGTEFGQVDVEFYVMSQCPYGTQVENAVNPALEKLGSAVDFKLNYIASELPDGSFNSLHGEPEAQGDIVQLCAAKYEPEKYMGMIVCMNEDARSIPGNWESCSEKLGLDTASIKSCYEGDEGKGLLSESAKASQAKGASGSPTIYIGGERYSGARDSLSFLRAFCNKLDNHPGCEELPECAANTDCNGQPGKIGTCQNPGEDSAKCVYSEPEAVTAILINDERCGSDCDVSNLKLQLKAIFAGLTFKEYDYSDAKGKEIMKDSGITMLPAILFTDSVQKGEGYAAVQTYLDKKGDYYNLRIGAAFDPTSEICTNGIDDTGNGLVDCADDTCANTIACREEINNNLQVFVMSDCPYGKKAIEALKPVIDNFEGDMDYEVHYIASETTDGGFNSLHGPYEADEDMVQLCVKKYSPDVWFDYIYCRSTNGVKNIDWKGCAEETGVDVASVETCFDGGEGANLLREDIKIAQELGIGASPTWLTNNRYQFSGIDAETIKSGYCQYNGDLSGCENVLSADSGSVPAGACG